MSSVLFLGGGRRVTLAEEFRRRGFSVYAYELTKEVPISSVAEVIIGKYWNDMDIVDHIKSIYEEKHIDLIIPLQDEATVIAASLKTLYPDMKVIVSLPIAAVTCFDKYLFSEYIKAKFNDLYIPTLYIGYNKSRQSTNEYDIELPVIIKPIFGFGSRKNIIANTESEVFDIIQKLDKDGEYILQTFVYGKEYSVDCYFNPSGEYVDSVVRERLLTFNGEVITSTTIDFDKLRELAKQVGETLGIIGVCNMQFIVTPEDKIYIIEINARFGGGVTLSIAAGLDMISLIYKDYLGGDYKYMPNSWKRGMLLERAFRDFYFEA